MGAPKVPMVTAIRIQHTTRYRYNQPVMFGDHRMLLRPRDGHDMRLVSSAIFISPEPSLRWYFDTFGNSVAIASFPDPADTLEIRSELLVRRFSHEDFLVSPDRVGTAMPVTYADEDRVDLAPFMQLENPGDREVLADWLDGSMTNRPDEVLAFLRQLSDLIHATFTYQRREPLGTQSAATTIQRGSGTCRDFALLFMEAARHFGFAARFVTGYLNTARNGPPDHQGGGSTHAWAEIYLPEEGWIEFDPTNRIVGSSALIRIAVTRTPFQATPISGTYVHTPGTEFLGMDVSVDVRTEAYVR
jgi:transglutaminase-like putative cysteine protease